MDFLLVPRTEMGDAHPQPALGFLVPEMSTVELDYAGSLEGAEEAFKDFIRLCIGVRD